MTAPAKPRVSDERLTQREMMKRLFADVERLTADLLDARRERDEAREQFANLSLLFGSLRESHTAKIAESEARRSALAALVEAFPDCFEPTDPRMIAALAAAREVLK